MYPANIGKKIPDKPFDIFGTIKTIGLRERIHSHDQSKLQVFSRTVSYKEEIQFYHTFKVVPLPICFLYVSCMRQIRHSIRKQEQEKKPVF